MHTREGIRFRATTLSPLGKMDTLLTSLPPSFHRPAAAATSLFPAAASAFTLETEVAADTPAAVGACATRAVDSDAALSCIRGVLAFADSATLGALACTSRALRTLSGEEGLWKPLAVGRWPELLHRADDTEWRDCFKRKREFPACMPPNQALPHYVVFVARGRP